MTLVKVQFICGLLVKVDWLKTVRFNLHYFKLMVALRLPVLVYRRTVFKSLKGTVTLKSAPKIGMIRLGDPRIGTQDFRYSRTIWQVTGEVIFKSTANFGRGCSVCVGTRGELVLGDKFSITGDTTILCKKQIVFGDDCLFSWDIMVMDTDWHYITDDNGDVINPDSSIIFGNHVWVGCRSMILKGSHIPSGSVIAAGSLISGKLLKENTVYGGQGKGVVPLKENIIWHH